jgi:hypothetical protein
VLVGAFSSSEMPTQSLSRSRVCVASITGAASRRKGETSPHESFCDASCQAGTAPTRVPGFVAVLFYHRCKPLQAPPPTPLQSPSRADPKKRAAREPPRRSRPYHPLHRALSAARAPRPLVC